MQKVLDTAYNEIGYLEKKDNNDLYDKKNNAGDGNFTKYAKDCFPGLQGLAWCCMFIWWCFEKTYGKIMARNLIGEPIAKCSIMKERMLAIGCEKVSNPKPGDIVFFDSGSGINHIGIVYKVLGNEFTTIEGNTKKGKDDVIPNGGGVWDRIYTIGNHRIDSFVRPLYNLLKDESSFGPNKKGKVNANYVNVRVGAGTEYRAIGMLNKPYELEILGSARDGSGREWYRFKYNGKDSYICSQYVSVEV